MVEQLKSIPHLLKCNSKSFWAIVQGAKKGTVRINDRGFSPYEKMILLETVKLDKDGLQQTFPVIKKTGNYCECLITHIDRIEHEIETLKKSDEQYEHVLLSLEMMELEYDEDHDEVTPFEKEEK